MRDRRIRYREIFFMHNGPGPWDCYRCGESIEYDLMHVHHKDGDHTNNSPDNLVPVTSSCHRKLHNAARTGTKRGPNKKNDYVPTSEHKRLVSIGQSLRWKNADRSDAYCECGAGPYRGQQGVRIHQTASHCIYVKQDRV